MSEQDGPQSRQPLPRREKNKERLTRRAMLGEEKHAEPAGGEEAEDWVVSYMDMVTLLMIVFLTLVGMLWVDKKTRPTVVNVLQAEAGRYFPDASVPEPYPLVRLTPDAPFQAPRRQQEMPEPPQTAQPAMPPQPQQPALPPYVSISPRTQAAVDHWVQAVRQNGLDDQVKLQLQENRVSIAIRDRLLFGSGQADIQDAGQSVIRRLASLLRSMPGTISVEGHTDDVPIRSERFPSNWELSAGRAAAVVRALTEAGLPAQRMRAIGYADSRPVARGSDEASRAQNRRVTLIVEDQR